MNDQDLWDAAQELVRTHGNDDQYVADWMALTWSNVISECEYTCDSQEN